MHPVPASLTLAVAAALSLPLAHAQAQAPATGYTGPSTTAASGGTPEPSQGHYSGPSSVPLMSVKQLLDTGRDDQHARLRGRIVSHDGDDRYTFADDTGRIALEISGKRFPPGRSVSAEQLVELEGEFEKGFRKVEFEVDRMVLVDG